MEGVLASEKVVRCYRGLAQVGDSDRVRFLGFRWTGSGWQEGELR